ncbi:MAG: MarR family transcriptional regulator [Acidobacteriota bacterium]
MDPDGAQEQSTSEAAAETDLGRRLQLRADLDLDEERTYLEIQRAAGLLLQAFTRLLRQSAPTGRGVTPSQYNVLRILRGAHPDGLPCHEIAERLLTPAPDVTRLLDRLKARGWLERTRDAEDRRVVRSCITPSGLDLVDSLDEPVRAWARGALGHLRDHEQARLWELLEAARTPLEHG